MRYWVQFRTLSTGYIAGTIPPQFGKPEPIDACGTDSVHVLDGRLSEHSMHRKAREYAQRMEHFKKFHSYRICQGERLFAETACSRNVSLTYPIQT